MANDTVYIFVEGGRVSDVMGTSDSVVVDLDLLKSGSCPICCADQHAGNYVCPVCKTDWKDVPDYDKIVTTHKDYRARTLTEPIPDTIFGS